MPNMTKIKSLIEKLQEAANEPDAATTITNVRKLVKQFGPSVTEFAARIDVSPVQVHRWLKTGRIPEPSAWKLQGKLGANNFSADRYLAYIEAQTEID